MIYSKCLQVKKILRSLPKAWDNKDAVIKDKDLHKITYDKWSDNIIAYVQNYSSRYTKKEMKKYSIQFCKALRNKNHR